MEPTPPPLPTRRSGREVFGWIVTIFGGVVMFGGLVAWVMAFQDSGYWRLRSVEYHPLLDRPPAWDLLPPPAPASICVLIFTAGLHLIVLGQILIALARR